MEVFDDITFEVYNGGWQDITADVCVDPSPKWNVGIMRNDLLARVADPGKLTFCLKNSTANAAHLLGYYSPDHANCWAGWTTGLAVRLSFYYDSNAIPWVKFYGWIAPNGIQVTPGQYGQRTIQVTCEDWISRASRHYLRLMEYNTFKRVDEALTLILENMPVQPTGTDFAVGNDTFPTVFDTTRNNTTAIAEMNKLALSEFGYIYCTSDGTLKFDARDTRSSSIVTLPAIPVAAASCDTLTDESGNILTDESGNILLADSATAASYQDAMSDGMKLSFGKNLCNQVRTTAYPRQADTSSTTVLFTLQDPLQMTSGQTISGYRCTYRDPTGANTKICGVNMLEPVPYDDYVANASRDGSGADLTSSLTVTASYGTEAVEYTLTAAADLYVTTLRALGSGVYIYDPVQIIKSDPDSQDIHGTKELSLEARYQNDTNNIDAFASFIISEERTPHTTVDACPVYANKSRNNMYGFLSLEPGKKATFQETVSGINGNYYIQGYNAQIISGKYVLWIPVLIDNPGFYYNNMSIATDGSAGDYILWGSMTGNANIPAASYSFWIKQDTHVAAVPLYIDYAAGGGEIVYIKVNHNGSGAVELYPGFSVTSPSWENRTNLLTTGAWHHVAITYNGSTTTTDPLLYVDGSTQSFTEYVTPSGAYKTPTYNRVIINGTGTTSIDGKLQDIRIYNRILGSTEVTDIYNSQYYTSVATGLIFQMRGTTNGPDGVNAVGVRDAVSKTIGLVYGTVLASADNKNFY